MFAAMLLMPVHASAGSDSAVTSCRADNECISVFHPCNVGWIPVHRDDEEHVRMGIASSGRLQVCVPGASGEDEAQKPEVACVQQRCVLEASQNGAVHAVQWYDCDRDEECVSVKEACGWWIGVNTEHTKSIAAYQEERRKHIECQRPRGLPKMAPKAVCVKHVCEAKW